MPHLSDEEILEHIQSGNTTKQNEAFRQLYRDNFRKIESLVLKNNGTHDIAKDIFHDGIIVFFNKAKKGIEMNSAIGTYLYAVCQNLWLNHLRKNKKQVPLQEGVEPESDSETIYDTLVVNEKKKIIAQLLEKMGDDCQKLIQLFYYHRMKMQNIKEVFGLGSEQAAKNKKSQCMKKLRIMVKDNANYKNMLTG